MTEPRCVLFHDNFQNLKSYNIPKAQLVIADIPYNIGSDFYASRPDWYVDGDMCASSYASSYCSLINLVVSDKNWNEGNMNSRLEILLKSSV